MHFLHRQLALIQKVQRKKGENWQKLRNLSVKQGYELIPTKIVYPYFSSSVRKLFGRFIPFQVEKLNSPWDVFREAFTLVFVAVNPIFQLFCCNLT